MGLEVETHGAGAFLGGDVFDDGEFVRASLHGLTVRLPSPLEANA